MSPKTLIQSLIVLALLTGTTPDAAMAKPNSYPGENSKFKSSDPAVIAQQKAEQGRRRELRKEKKEERRRERLERRSNRSN
ncbi:hypothetical protein [Ruegeria sp. 6PALISEP08]|uniref:hypothetical protein n=1 Tax=Ruegeria sp. 6PALISEP08 TaxID=1225660 RepID=UPI00067EB996|nr:hypothetical protein [Ruegeria sp. 6PALISEP08]